MVDAGGMPGVKNLVVIGWSCRISVASSEIENLFDLLMQASERICQQYVRLACIAHCRDEMPQTVALTDHHFR